VWLAPALAAGLAMLWITVDRPDDGGVKGGEVAVQVIGADGLALHDVKAGQALKLTVSCSARDPVAYDVVVYDGDGATFPLPRSEGLTCGNGAVIPGAFGLTKTKIDARVCVVLGHLPVDLPSREALAAGESGACTTIHVEP